jgi:predicted metal-binding membrane protein
MTSINKNATTFTIVLLAGIIGASWIISIRLMNGMDMGVATRLGSFIPFIVMWTVMMAAMMLPGISPAIVRIARTNSYIRKVLIFIVTYLVVWALFGVIVYFLYRPHDFTAAGITVIAAGIYELTPLKKNFRGCCYIKIDSGFKFGLHCVGCTIGLMLIQVELGIMSLIWMLVITVIITAQKLLPAKAAIDTPLALAIIGFGILIILAPSTVHSLMTPM